MFEGLVTGRYYGIASEGRTYTEAVRRPGWLRRIIAAIFGRKS